MTRVRQAGTGHYLFLEISELFLFHPLFVCSQKTLLIFSASFVKKGIILSVKISFENESRHACIDR